MKSWFIVLGIVLGIVLAQQVVPRLMPARLPAMEALDDPPGFRSLPVGQISGAASVFAGIDAGKQAEGFEGDLCTALFGADWAAQKGVSVAYFHDYQCPYCRVLSGHLRDVDGISLRHHLLGWLGPASEVAARAALAAGMQGAGEAFDARLARTRLVPSEGYALDLAAQLGLDAERFRADMQSTEVNAELAQAEALARRFGLPGTPALVVGRTLAIGEITPAELEQLIEIEAEAGPPPC